MIRVVFDPSLTVAAARSRTGASHALVEMLPSVHFQVCLSTALFTEWADVLTRPEHRPAGRSPADVIAALDVIGKHAYWQPIYFRWRPFLTDPGAGRISPLAVPRMNSLIQLSLPDPIRQEAEMRAMADGVSLEKFLLDLTTHYLEAQRQFDDLRARAERADPDALKRYLDAVPDAEPLETDRLPEGWKPLR